jgi:uncharacterized protein YggE
MINLRHAAALLAASAMTALPASAAPPVAASATVDLHIDAVGIAPPDFAVAPVTLNGSGTSREAAEGQLAGRRDTLMKTLAGLGVAAGKVKLGAVTVTEQDLVCYDTMCNGDDGVAVPVSEIPEEAFLDDFAYGATEAAFDESCPDCAVAVPVVVPPPVAVAPADAASAYAGDSYGMRRAHLWIATSEGTVQVDDLAKVADVGTAISAVGKWSASTTRYEFVDRTKARKAALADGLKQARAQADAYAASIGCRVVRIKGLSNTGAPFSVTDIFTMLSRTEGPGKDNKFMQSEFAPVGVDFVLVAL